MKKHERNQNRACARCAVAQARGLANPSVYPKAKACQGYHAQETKTKGNKQAVPSVRPALRGGAGRGYFQTPEGESMSLLLTIALLWLGAVVFVSVGMGILYVLDILENRFDQ